MLEELLARRAMQQRFQAVLPVRNEELSVEKNGGIAGIIPLSQQLVHLLPLGLTRNSQRAFREASSCC